MQEANKGIVERTVNKFYWTAKRQYKNELRCADNARSALPILVYTMGKVGSTSITRALEENPEGVSVYHVHFLTGYRLEQLEQARRRFFRSPYHRRITKTWEAQYVADLIRQNAGKRKFKVISLVRDPVARNIADYFQHLDLTDIGNNRFQARSYWYDFEYTFDADDVSVVIDRFFRHFDHVTSLEFFDAEMKAVFREDIYANPFPRDKGYAIFSNDLADILVLRLESLKECAVPALEEFLNLHDVTIRSSNVGEQKQYSRLYTAFKEQIKFPGDYLDRIYGSRMARHFYSDKELEKFRRKWSG